MNGYYESASLITQGSMLSRDLVDRVTTPSPVNRTDISYRRSSAHNSGLLVILTVTLGTGVQHLKQATTGIRDAWSLPERSWAVEMEQCRPKCTKQSHSIGGGHTDAGN